MPDTPLTFILSDESVNAYGFKVLTAGIDLDQFKKNPVMLFNHCDDEVIGRWDNIRVEGTQLKADAVFDENDPEALQIKSKVENGFIKGASLGFNIIEISEDEQTGKTIVRCKAFEASIVAMPANEAALYDEMGRKCAQPAEYLTRLSKTLQLNKKPDMKLNLQSLTTLGLKLEATEADINNAIMQLAHRAADAEDQLTKLKAETAAQLKQRAEALVDGAIALKKLTAADRDEYVKQATDNFAFVEKTLLKMGAPVLPGSHIKADTGTGGFNMPKEYVGLSLRQIEAKGGEKIIARLKREAPELYTQMYVEQYGKNPQSKPI